MFHPPIALPEILILSHVLNCESFKLVFFMSIAKYFQVMRIAVHCSKLFMMDSAVSSRQKLVAF